MEVWLILHVCGRSAFWSSFVQGLPRSSCRVDRLSLFPSQLMIGVRAWTIFLGVASLNSYSTSLFRGTYGFLSLRTWVSTLALVTRSAITLCWTLWSLTNLKPWDLTRMTVMNCLRTEDCSFTSVPSFLDMSLRLNSLRCLRRWSLTAISTLSALTWKGWEEMDWKFLGGLTCLQLILSLFTWSGRWVDSFLVKYAVCNFDNKHVYLAGLRLCSNTIEL